MEIERRPQDTFIIFLTHLSVYRIFIIISVGAKCVFFFSQLLLVIVGILISSFSDLMNIFSEYMLDEADRHMHIMSYGLSLLFI